MLMYAGQTALLRRLVNPGDATAYTFRSGIAGPNLLRWDKRPNYFTDAWSLSPRDKLTDFIAAAFSNDGAAPDDDVRDLFGYARSEIAHAKVTRDHHGAVIDLDWTALASRIEWAPLGDFKPDDWDATYPGVEFSAPWGWADLWPYEPVKGFPWNTPIVFEGYYNNYSNPTASPPQNPWGVDCPSCKALGPWGLSSFPVGLAYVTIQRADGEEQILSASLFNDAMWWRNGGTLYYRCAWRFGRINADYAYRVIGSLFDPAITLPYTGGLRCVALSTPASAIKVNNPTLDQLALAFPDDKAADNWVFTEYTPEDAGPPLVVEVLPAATLHLLDTWTNASGADAVVRTIAIVAWNPDRGASGAYDVLFWGAMDDEVTVPDGDEFRLDGFEFRITDLAGA